MENKLIVSLNPNSQGMELKPVHNNGKNVNTINAGLCSSRAWWPLVSNFCSWATRKSQIFHTNHMLDTVDDNDN